MTTDEYLASRGRVRIMTKNDGSMSANDYRKAIAELGLNQVTAGRFLGVDPRTSRRYALGEVKIPEPTAMLLRLMLARNISVAAASRA